MNRHQKRAARKRAERRLRRLGKNRKIETVARNLGTKITEVMDYVSGVTGELASRLGMVMQLQELYTDELAWTPEDVAAKLKVKREQAEERQKAEQEKAKERAAAAAAVKEQERIDALEPEEREKELARIALDKEIAEHNAAVDTAKQEKEHAQTD